MNPTEVASPPVKRTERPARPPQKTAHRGICATCRRAPTCAFLSKDGRVVLNCEEFTPVDPPLCPSVRSVRAASTPRPPASPADRRGREKVLGLCASCERYDTCGFPKPEGGVWRCEEYQ